MRPYKLWHKILVWKFCHDCDIDLNMNKGVSMDQYLSPNQRRIKSVVSLGNNEVLKALTFKFCDLDLKVKVMSADVSSIQRWIMPCFSLREFDPHLPDYYYISRVSRVLHFHMFLMTETIKLCPDANKMMLCYAIS